jgi:hypothetical protein
MSKRTIELAAAGVVLAAVVTGSAIALAAQGNERTARRGYSKPHIDIPALGSNRGVPTDPAARVKFLRNEVLAFSFVGFITPAQAQRALRELRQTGTLGKSLHTVQMKVSSLTSLPPQAHVPAEVARFVSHVGHLTHSGQADVRSVRLLRSSLGTGNGDVYGVTSAAGSPCFILTGYGGTCAGGGNAARTGLGWIIGGAYNDLPGVFVGLAADDVRSVQLNVDGASVPVSLRSNVAFAELPERAHDAIVTTTRAGGRISSESLELTR